MTLTGSTGPSENGYLEFPDMSFFEEKSQRLKEQHERNMQTEDTYATIMGIMSEMGLEGKPSTHFIHKAKDLHKEYISCDNEADASKLIDRIIDYLLRKLLICRSVLEENSIGREGQVTSERFKGERIEKEKLDELIKFFEDIFRDLDKKFGFYHDEKYDGYRQRKKEILEGKPEFEGKIDTTQSSITIPNLPVLYQDKTPVVRRINFNILNLLSIGTKWEELERKVGEFSKEITEEINGISDDITSNPEFLERKIGEILDGSKSKYNFPRGFDITLSTDDEVNPPPKEEDKYRSPVSEYRNKVVNRYLHSSEIINVNFTLKLPEEIPFWISGSFDITYPYVDLRDFSGLGVYKMNFGNPSKGGEQGLDSMTHQLPFMIQLSQKSKELRDVTKIREKIEEDPIIRLFYYQTRSRSQKYDFTAVDSNAKNIVRVWEARQELKNAVEWLSFDNVKGILHGKGRLSYDNLISLLEENMRLFLPVPSGYLGAFVKNLEGEKYTDILKDQNRMYFAHEGRGKHEIITFDWYNSKKDMLINAKYYRLKIWGKYELWDLRDGQLSGDSNKTFDDLVKGAKDSVQKVDSQRLFIDLEYYFKTKKSHEFSVGSVSPQIGRQLSKYRAVGQTFELKSVDFNNLGYESIHVQELNGRLHIAVYRNADKGANGEQVVDSQILQQVQGLIWEAIQYVQNGVKSGKKK